MVNKKLKRVNEKSVLFAVFILLAILALGSLFIVKPKMTGFVSIIDEHTTKADCEAANYTWQNITVENCTSRDICLADCPECEEVVIGEGCENLTYIIRENCEAANYTWQNITVENCTGRDICLADCPECEEIVTGGQCVGDCDADHLDLCVEANCSSVNGYWYNSACNPNPCVPSCDGKDCGNDGCGGSCPPGCGDEYTCDSGVCQGEDTSSDDNEGDTNAGVTGDTIDDTTSSCVCAWACEGWSECSATGTQTRTCTDVNNCVAEEGKPTESQSCTVPESLETPETPETCSDGIKNQDEKGIDCGGVCEQRCSFFTIMGNAVNVPVNSTKQFVQNNKAISFSILGVIVLAVSWIICVKVFLKKENIFFFVEEIKKRIKGNSNS